MREGGGPGDIADEIMVFFFFGYWAPRDSVAISLFASTR